MQPTSTPSTVILDDCEVCDLDLDATISRFMRWDGKDRTMEMGRKGMSGILDKILPPDATKALKFAAVGGASVYVTEQALSVVLPMVWKTGDTAKVIDPIPRAVISGVAGLLGGGLVAAIGRKRDISLAWSVGPMTMAAVAILGNLLTPKPAAGGDDDPLLRPGMRAARAHEARLAAAGLGEVGPAGMTPAGQPIVADSFTAWPGYAGGMRGHFAGA